VSVKTVAQIEDAIRYRADLEGFQARHPQARIVTLINDAYRDLRARLTADGSPLFLQGYEGVESTVGRAAGYPGSVLFITTCKYTLVKSVSVQSSSGAWLALTPISVDDALCRPDLDSVGCPLAYCVCGTTAEVSLISTDQWATICVVPALDSARRFLVRGLPLSPALTISSSLTTDYGLDRYLVATVAAQCCSRDQESGLRDDLLAEANAAYVSLRKLSKIANLTPRVRQDVRGRRWR
jgi:hypothetical protein